MKTSLIVRTLVAAVLCYALSLSPSVASDTVSDMLNQAFDLLHQAWNPGGEPPSVADRIDLLNKALKLIEDTPDHHLKKHRKNAELDIKAALDLLNAGDPDNKATDPIHDAADQVKDALSISE